MPPRADHFKIRSISFCCRYNVGWVGPDLLDVGLGRYDIQLYVSFTAFLDIKLLCSVQDLNQNHTWNKRRPENIYINVPLQ